MNITIILNDGTRTQYKDVIHHQTYTENFKPKEFYMQQRDGMKINILTRFIKHRIFGL